MKKLRQLLRFISLIMAMMLLISCTSIDVRALKASQNTPDAAPVDSLEDKNSKPASFAPSMIYLESDASEELYTRYDAGAVISFDYSVQSAFDADEYRITCEGESITLLSPSMHSIDPTGSYKLEFRAPQKGAGKIVLTFMAIKNGNASGEEAYAYLYWSSCDLGVFVSAAEPVPELVMAKAQYDANDITSRDYYNIVHNQHFQVDIELMNMLSRVASDKAEYSGYAAPYVEAVHNSIFCIESKAEVPAISDTLKKIEDELGVDLNDTGSSSVQSNALDTTVTVSGKVMWTDATSPSGSQRPATNIRLQIVDIYTYEDLFGTYGIETILIGDDNNPFYTDSNGNYSADIPDGASVRDGGYDIVVRVLAEGSNVSVSPFLGATYEFEQGIFPDIATSPPDPINFIADQDSTSPNYMKAIQVQQAAALASEFAKIMNDGSYLGEAEVIFPALESSSFYFNTLNIANGQYDLWDVIMHEFGHYVADQLGTFVPLPAQHDFTSNLWDSGALSKEEATILAWQEGWASYFAFYAQRYMINTAHYIGAYNTGCGVLGDLLYWGSESHNIENLANTSGEANEGSVMALLWDITDSGTNEPFDTLHRDFATIWNCVDNGNCTTLNIFINTLYPEFSPSEQPALGNILSEYNISPRLTTPADGAVLLATTPPTFEWEPGGSPIHPNNHFTLSIYQEESGEVTNLFTSESQTSLSYTISQNDWNDIIARHVNNTLYWSVSGAQTEELVGTGPYLSNSLSFIFPLQTPELIDAVSLNPNMILLLWNKVPGATGYSIYRSDSLSGTYARISDSFEPYAPIPNTMSYIDTGLTPGKTYYYKIKATGESESEYSNTMSAVAAYKFTYNLNPDNTLTITGYSGTNFNVVIPSTINGKTVTAIGNDVFASRGLTSVVIPNSITSIGARAFRLTTKLTSITIPNSVISIGEAAFQGSSITSIILSNNITEISANMFNSSKLKSIIIPNNVTSIGANAFSNCTDLSDVTLSSNLINIGNGAFSNTPSLTHITLPNGITNIGEYAFSYSNLTSIILPDGLTTISARAFMESKLTSIVMPNSLISIGDDAFCRCYNLENVSIPESIQYIGTFSFWDCTALSRLDIKTSSPDCVIGDQAFSGCTGLSSVTIDTLGSIGNWAFSGCNNIKVANLTNVKSIGVQAFHGCTSLEEVSISNTDVIGEFAFIGCNNLMKAYLTNVKNIEMQAFGECTSLEEVSISNVDVVGDYAFFGCINLISASIDATEIGQRAFSDCQSLSDLYLADGIEIIGDWAFGSCPSLLEVDIPNSVTHLGDMAFVLCTSLTRVLIPGSIPEIGTAAFAECSSLYDVTLGEGIVKIMQSAFANCTALTQITIPSSVTYIDETAFQGSGIEL